MVTKLLPSRKYYNFFYTLAVYPPAMGTSGRDITACTAPVRWDCRDQTSGSLQALWVFTQKNWLLSSTCFDIGDSTPNGWRFLKGVTVSNFGKHHTLLFLTASTHHIPLVTCPTTVIYGLASPNCLYLVYYNSGLMPLLCNECRLSRSCTAAWLRSGHRAKLDKVTLT